MNFYTKEPSFLIVEDDDFKLEGIRSHILDTWGGNSKIRACEALSTAVDSLSREEFDIVIVDMSIPSHPQSIGVGSPYSFPSGGLDILLEIDFLGHQSVCIVLTQYPEIEIEGELIPVEQAKTVILEKLGVAVESCIQYFEDNPKWKQEMNLVLGI